MTTIVSTGARGYEQLLSEFGYVCRSAPGYSATVEMNPAYRPWAGNFQHGACLASYPVTDGERASAERLAQAFGFPNSLASVPAAPPPAPVIVRSPAAPAPEPRRVSVPAPEPKQQRGLDDAVQVYQNARGLMRSEPLRQVMAEHPVYRSAAHAGDFERMVEAEAVARADHSVSAAIATVANKNRAAYFAWVERGSPRIAIQPSKVHSTYREAVHARARADGVALTVAAHRVAQDPQTKHLHAAWREQGYPSIQ